MNIKKYPYSTSVSVFSRYIRKKLLRVDTLNYHVWIAHELWNDQKRVSNKEIFISSLWLYCGMMNLKGYMPDKVLKLYDFEEKLLATYSEAEKQAVFYD